MKNFITILLISISLINCKSVDKSSNYTYFGGKIINPKGNFVMLMKGDKPLDTIYLNKDNTFSTQLNLIKEGLYSFKHGPEYQYVYFEPNDSIVIRLNTWDFDESLVFSGKGSEKNNFLITLYLQNEKNSKSFKPYYNLNPKEFLAKTATIESINKHIYNQLKKSGVKLTKNFETLAKVAVSYPVYLRKEIYPYRHKNRFQLDSFPKLPDGYYNYRKNIDLNKSELIDYFPYHNYVNNYLYNLAYKECNEKESATENILNTIVSNIKVEEFRNRLMYQAIYSDFRSNQNSCCINKTALEIFNKNCTDKELLKRINTLAEDCENNKDNSPIEDFALISTHDNSTTNLKSIIKNKKSVIYFWSPNKLSSELLIKRVNRLKNNYPSLRFIGININPSKNGSRINQYLKNQYLLPKESVGHKLIKSKEPRTILIDDKGIIVNSFTYLSSPHLEKQLRELQNN